MGDNIEGGGDYIEGWWELHGGGAGLRGRELGVVVVVR